MKFKSLNHIIRSVASQLRPPMRMTVAEAAAKYRYVNQPGAYVGPWLNMTTPYMVEPMNTLNSRHEGTVTRYTFSGSSASIR